MTLPEGGARVLRAIGVVAVPVVMLALVVAALAVLVNPP